MAVDAINLDNAMYPKSPLYSYDDYTDEITQNNTNYFNSDFNDRPFDDPLLKLVENNPDLLTLINAVDSQNQNLSTSTYYYDYNDSTSTISNLDNLDLDLDLDLDSIDLETIENSIYQQELQTERLRLRNQQNIEKSHSMDNTLKPINFWSKMIPSFHKILDHGCWCSALVQNSNILPKTEPIDQLDYICQSWTICRRCTRETASNCKASHNISKNTTITEKFNHNFECDAEDDCTNSLCRCNMQFVVEISQYFRDFYGEYVSDVDENFEPEVASRKQCGVDKIRDEDLFGIRIDELQDLPSNQDLSSGLYQTTRRQT